MTDPHTGIADAVQRYVADTYPGAYVTDWVVIAHGALPDRDDATVYVHEASQHSTLHVRLGLARYLFKRYDRLITEDDE